MQADLSPVIAATAHWLNRAYPPSGGALAAALCEVQARQAVTVAAWLRYPTAMDAALLGMAGPGGSARLDWVTGADAAGDRDTEDHHWRTWVDEVVASWAACLLTDPELAELAVTEVSGGEHTTATPAAFRRLLTPDATDRRAAALLRHPDLLAPVAGLHRDQLLDRLGSDEALIA
ncbi:hypothetical protein [Streptomyces griseorubiginosus]|uniref:hypothetical protein n=1 Tax=Streptomyces griseorubiginosus TaxID=67304 RepID=UPI002E81E7D7|nr:hypothetical protein [Streptomyces griseorubiginosus]WUB42173.1 hypothetical protein OHN19_02065 [Streptomyces griseorubiginosus]WUB50692.1 hypothetical protein OG942_02060 [Streptomyces griseorubiginosus]